MATLSVLAQQRVPPASAYDLETSFAVASIIQLHGVVEDTDTLLTAELLKQQAAKSVPDIPREYGVEARSRVKRIIKELQPEMIGNFAASTALKAKVLSRDQAHAVQAHCKEAEERLAGILEADALDARKKNALGQLDPSMRPEELRFLHRSLMAADLEVKAAVACFGEDERRAAAKFASSAVVPLSPIGESARPTTGDVVGPAREEAIKRAIDAMPVTSGTALTRSSLQNKLENEFVSEMSSASKVRQITSSVPQ